MLRLQKAGCGTSVPSGATVTKSQYFPKKYGGHSNNKGPGGIYTCSYCGVSGRGALAGICYSHVISNAHWLYWYDYTVNEPCKGCPKICYSVKGHSYKCGQSYPGGTYTSQAQERVEERGIEEEIINWAELGIELGSTIEVKKQWEDYENENGVRPENLHLNVYRSVDKANWELLKENTDYVVTIENKGTTEWKILISGLLRVDNNGKDYYFKVEEKETMCYTPEYPNGNLPTFGDNPAYGQITIKNKLKHVNLEGYAWLDGQTGIKPAIPNNGIMDKDETKLENIVVYLYYKKPKTQGGEVVKVAETVTDKNGHYEFKDREIGRYYVEFYYDGIHYEDTIKIEEKEQTKAKDYYDYPVISPIKKDVIKAKAFEKDENRNKFNERFQTITYKKSNDGTNLTYKYENKKSILITNDDGKTTIKKEFQMTATTPMEVVYLNVDDLNLGLVKRGTDLALSTDVYDAKVTINGKETTYTYNKENDTIQIGETETKDKVTYNLNLYQSDYEYRIRDYVNTQDFKEKDYINNEKPEGIKTGDELKVNVTYELNLQNQSTKTTKINEVKYVYDEKYTFKGLRDNNFGTKVEGTTITIDLNGLELKEGETKTLYLNFEVNKKVEDGSVELGDFSNKAEITSYSNDEGLIDVDSQPGNFINNGEVEDDNDTAGGLKIQVVNDPERKITGIVFDEKNNKVNDVIVQLIELKTVNGKTYEYIWQETVSGTDNGIRLNGTGNGLNKYTYTKTEGYYEFKGFIPGDYIVRFIYGDGTTYDMTDNVIKYNGQDYKSIKDTNYKEEWYKKSAYKEGASVARDNEARRLETMGYSVEIDAEKGVLLKLLGNGETRPNADTLNLTEKEILVATYNKYYDPDIKVTKIENVSNEDINKIVSKLLKEEVLKNTWMCAETSKIMIAVDTTDASNLDSQTVVDGTARNYANNISNINLGLELRPETKIELKKYITGFKLTASNGQTLVNAYVDVNEYLKGTADISNKVQGIKDHVTILDTLWQYEVVPTEINTTVDGANLEFEYTVVVKNTGADDYLSKELANIYNNKTAAEYKTYLNNKAAELKTAIRNGTYRTQIGNTIGSSYYLGGKGQEKVLTEITSIRDYINNDLKYVASGDVAIDENAPKTHRILRDDYSMQEATINTILKTTKTTGKLDNNGTAVMYKVSLGKNPISSTGNLNFENYIAEVMAYTNAAGRRTLTSTPGNAEIVDHEHREGRTHEIDEADTGRIQVGAATGEDQKTNYIVIITAVTAIVVIAAGAVVVKKFILK